MSRSLEIDGVVINDDSDCFVIAEIGHNHQGNLEKCKSLFKAAWESGANAVKLQKRHNKTLFTKEAYDQPYNSENAYTPTYGEHREFLEFGEAEYKELIAYAKELGITFFSTAFDIRSADFLEELDMPCYKIASADLVHTPLLRHVARFKKPMFISTGGATMEDVQRAYDTIMPINDQLCIMQCTAAYPCEMEDLNLRVIETYRNAFPDCIVGLSDHENGIAMPLVAFMMGARVLEKHFTLNRAWKGTDHVFSLGPTGLRKVIRDLRRTRLAMGGGIKRRLPTEEAPLRKMSKSLVAAQDLPAGHILGESDLAMRAPGDGLPPYHLDALVGRRLNVALAADEAVRLEMIGDA